MHADIVIQDIKITKAVVFTFTDVKMGSKKLRRSPLPSSFLADNINVIIITDVEWEPNTRLGGELATLTLRWSPLLTSVRGSSCLTGLWPPDPGYPSLASGDARQDLTSQRPGMMIIQQPQNYHGDLAFDYAKLKWYEIKE